MHFIIGEVYGYLKKKNGNKYLTFASTYIKKEVLKKYTELWNEIKSLIDKIEDKPGEYGKYFMKIKFNSYHIMFLNKILKLHILTVIFRYLFYRRQQILSTTFLRWMFALTINAKI